LYNNTAASVFTTSIPNTTVTVSLSNQQYTNIPAAGSVGTGTGVSIGATSTAGTKAVSGVPFYNIMSTIGTPNSNQYTNTSTSTTGTGIDVGVNYAFDFLTTVEPLASFNNGGTPRALSGRYQYADLTISFNRPVTNPVLHFVGLGGNFSYSVNNVVQYVQGFATELDLLSTGVTLTKLSGANGMAVTSTSIKNSYRPLSGVCGTSAACGSVQVNTGTGSISNIVFRIYVQGDGTGQDWSRSVANGSTVYAGDRWMLGVSMAATDAVILPVTAMNLSAVRQNKDVLLKWNTFNEKNTLAFTVERSYDGRSFEGVGTVVAAGNSMEEKTYSLVDQGITKNIVYYRVVLKDLDGKRTLSNTAVLRMDGLSKGNRIFPNPVEGSVINIEFAKTGNYTIALYNPVGQKLLSRIVEAGSGTITSISRNGLPAGNYTIKISKTDGSESELLKAILK
jgi:hypothetical protein